MMRPLRGSWREESATSSTKPWCARRRTSTAAGIRRCRARSSSFRAEMASGKLVVIQPSALAAGRCRSGRVARGGVEEELAGAAGRFAGGVDGPAGAHLDRVVGGDGAGGLDRSPFEPDRAVGVAGAVGLGVGSRCRPRARREGEVPRGRWVRTSSARARRASGRPPVRVSAKRSTARAKGTPFQVVTWAPTAKSVSWTSSVVLVTR